MDDVVVKTKQSGTLLDNLKETFTNLRRYRMKLNPEKCTFGVLAGQLMACKNSSLGTPRGRYDEHSSKSSLSYETKVY
jgi:hypothetical protein